MRQRFYRRDGSPYPPGIEGTIEWGRDFEKPELKRVALDKLPNGVEVSTVWLGLDHNYSSRGRPLIFETMLFVRQKKIISFGDHTMKFDREEIGEQWRYSTEEEALLGHKMQVKMWKTFKTADQVLEKIQDKANN